MVLEVFVYVWSSCIVIFNCYPLLHYSSELPCLWYKFYASNDRFQSGLVKAHPPYNTIQVNSAKVDTQLLFGFKSYFANITFKWVIPFNLFFQTILITAFIVTNITLGHTFPSLSLSLPRAFSSSILRLSSSLHFVLKLFSSTLSFSHFSEYFFFSMFLIF